MSVEYVLHARDLSPAHLGRRIRVKVLGGAIIEDELVSILTDSPKAPRIFLCFNTVKSHYSGPDMDFSVLPGTDIQFIGSDK